MAQAKTDAITSQIIDELAGTKYACKTLTPLTGGTANFIYKGMLQVPLDDGTTEVVVKHGEGFVAQNPALKISTLRCNFEEECLQAVQKLPPTISESCCIRTPRLFYFSQESNTQVQEYLDNALNLKAYALKYFSTSATPGSANESERPKILEVGRGLGRWLRSFHEWAASPEQEALRNRVKMNKEMQYIKFTYGYQNLLWRSDKLPSILGDAKPVFEEVFAKAKAELEDQDNLQVIHGDFWTGNVLLPDTELKSIHQVPLLIIDWEMSQVSVRPLDLGQMIAELYELTLYKGIKAGLWIIEGFTDGYGFVDDEFAYRTALHVGTHLVGFGTTVAGWGGPEQIEHVARTGRDIILRAWQKDRSWFEDHDLAPLFKTDSK